MHLLLYNPHTFTTYNISINCLTLVKIKNAKTDQRSKNMFKNKNHVSFVSVYFFYSLQLYFKNLKQLDNFFLNLRGCYEIHSSQTDGEIRYFF